MPTSIMDNLESRFAEIDKLRAKVEQAGVELEPVLKEHFLTYAREHVNPHFATQYHATDKNVTVGLNADNKTFSVIVDLDEAKGADQPLTIRALKARLSEYAETTGQRVTAEVNTNLPSHAFRTASPAYD
jgi:hypothetical protein